VKKITLLALLIFSATASAADFDNCLIKELVIHSPAVNGDENFHFRLDCPISGPGCAATAKHFAAFDRSSTSGMQMLSVVMNAFDKGYRVTGYVDDNNCPAWQGNVALLEHLRVVKP